MKHTLLFIFSILFLSSCTTRNSNQSDASTGLEANANGLKFKEVIIKIDGKEDNRNSFVFGEDIVFQIDGITGMKVENNKTSPGMELTVIDQKSLDTMLYHPDLLQNYEIEMTDDKKAVILEANLSPAFPYSKNEEYEIQLHLWDKNGTGTIDMSMPFTIHNDRFEVEREHIEYDKLYFFDPEESKVAVDNQLKKEKTTVLYLEGVENLSEENGRIYPKLSLYAIDAQDTILINEENIMAAYTEQGLPPNAIFGQIPVNLSFSGNIANPVNIQVELIDTRTDGFLRMNTLATIE